ncbi:MAG: hypothetical protein WC558_10140 [Patulibacter sp.]
MEHSEGEKALLRRMNIASFRHVSKDSLVALVDGLPTLDPQVALKVLAQVPHLTKLTSEVLADNAGAHQGTLLANADSTKRVQELRLKRQQALIELLARGDASDEVVLQAMAGLDKLEEDARQDEAANKRWLSQQSETRMKTALTLAAGVGALVLIAAQSGGQPVSALSRLLSSAKS